MRGTLCVGWSNDSSVVVVGLQRTSLLNDSWFSYSQQVGRRLTHIRHAPAYPHVQPLIIWSLLL